MQLCVVTFWTPENTMHLDILKLGICGGLSCVILHVQMCWLSFCSMRWRFCALSLKQIQYLPDDVWAPYTKPPGTK